MTTNCHAAKTGPIPLLRNLQVLSYRFENYMQVVGSSPIVLL